MLHVHNDKVETIVVTYDPQTGFITLDVDGFSTFGIVYKDTKVTDTDDNNDNTNNNTSGSGNTSANKDDVPETGD